MVRMFGRIEVVSGLLAGLLGLALLAYVVFGPAYDTVRTAGSRAGVTWTTRGATSMVQVRLEPPTIAFLIVMGLCMVGVALAAYRRRHRGGGAWLVLLHVCAGLLVLGVVLSIVSIGLFLLPAAVLAVTAAVAGNRTQRRNNATH
jgi:hypothetical protein